MHFGHPDADVLLSTEPARERQAWTKIQAPAVKRRLDAYGSWARAHSLARRSEGCDTLAREAGEDGAAKPRQVRGRATDETSRPDVNACRPALSTLTWRFAPVLSRFAGEGFATAWEITKQFGFWPK